jgi:ABC-type multidrug transport system ATPase subunit
MAEQEIFNQFDSLREGKTTIFVSHRLSSAVIATKILVLEYGELIEEGNHHELMAKKGKYYDLFSTQARRYLEGGDEVELPGKGDGSRRPHGPHGRRRPPADDGGIDE